MNILYYLLRFPKLSESFVLNEIYELTNRGHNVAVFALSDPAEHITHEEYDELDIPVQYADIPSYTDVGELVSPKLLRPDVLKHSVFKASLTQHAAALYWGKQCIEFVEDWDSDVDLVHSHFANINTFPARYVASYYDVPSTVTTHAYDLYDDPNRIQLEHVLSTADRIVTISEYNRSYIKNELTEKTPISVVRAGIRPEKYTPTTPTADTRILTVARFVEKKGLPYAIEAVSKVTDQFPDLKYHIVGSGEMERDIRDRIKEHELTDTVELLNKISDERLITEFDRANCFVLPSVVAESGDRDGIPVALMESMAMETPPISTDVSGIPELIDHRQNGLIVEPRNVDELSKAISSILSSPETQRRLGEAGRQTVTEKFNVQHETTKLESLFANETGRDLSN